MFMTLSSLRHALRRLHHAKASSAVIVTTVGLALAAVSTVFTFAFPLLVRPMPLDREGRTVAIFGTSPRGSSENVSAPAFLDYRAAARTVESVAALRYGGGGTLRGPASAERVLGVSVTPNFFSTLGVAPMLGRWFTGNENPDSVILSAALWRRFFHADPNVISSRVEIVGGAVTIVGVLPDEFWFANRQIEFWRPLRFTAAQTANRADRPLTVVARLRPSTTSLAVQHEARDIAARLSRQYPATDGKLGLRVEPLADRVNREIRPMLAMLTLAVLCLLLIAAANVAGILTARTMDRAREFAVRTALGAPRRRLIGQVLAENLVLGVIGCLAGLPLAHAASRWLLSIIPIDYQYAVAGIDRVGVSAPVLAASLAAAVGMSLLFALAPALYATRSGVQPALRAGSRVAPARTLARGTLVAVQIALGVVLLTGTAVILTEMARLGRADVGYQPDRVLSMRLFLGSGYNDILRFTRFLDQAAARAHELPSVQAASFATYLPVSELGTVSAHIEGRQEPESAAFLVVSPGYFRTLGIGLLQGRDFVGRDDSRGPRVALVNETLAKRYWPRADALGRRIRLPMNDEPFEIAGVVSDARPRLSDRVQPTIYATYAQIGPAGTVLMVRSAGDPASLTAALRRAVWSLDRDISIRWEGTLRQFDDDELWQRRLSTRVLGLLALIAVLLAGAGVYGVLASYVSERVPEIGIRMALGATPGDIRAQVLKPALAMSAAGTAAGVGLALAANRAVRSLLFGIQLSQWTTMALVAAFFFAVACVAAYMPILRAIRVDPAASLRRE